MLNGKRGVVTGGGTGIGLAIARTLADAGAEIWITGRRAEVLEAAGGGLRPLVMDVSVEASVVDGMARIAQDGPISICVANAGIAEGQNILGSSTEFWRSVMATNLDGTYFTLREALRHMDRDGWGRVIAISSIAGIRGLKGAHAYAASKHGIEGLIKTLALDFAKSDWTFNTICPAYVETDIVSRNVEKIKEKTGMDDAQAMGVMLGANPHGRLITPQEVANAALWLCGPGSDSVNGASIEVAGGPL